MSSYRSMSEVEIELNRDRQLRTCSSETLEESEIRKDKSRCPIMRAFILRHEKRLADEQSSFARFVKQDNARKATIQVLAKL